MNSSIKQIRGYYVVHFLQLLITNETPNDPEASYQKAIRQAKPLGGRKFHNKDFGGGIAFEYLSQAEEALEFIRGEYLCPVCRNEWVTAKGVYCNTCEEAHEKLMQEKDAQRQADRDRYSQTA
jgi:hypothetical protein